MPVDQETIIHKDHVEFVLYYEDVLHINPYMTDTHIHIFNSDTNDPHHTEESY